VTTKTFGELVRNHGALDRDKSVGPLGSYIFRLRNAGTKWGSGALDRSNYAALVAEYGNEPWCAVDPDDGPLYISGGYSDDGLTYVQGHYDDTPHWDDGVLPFKALVFHDGEVYVNTDFEYDDEDDGNLRLLDLADMLDSLDGYPVIDEEAFSALEYEEALESLEDTAKWDLPRIIKAQHAYGDEALELDTEWEVTVDDIVAACRTLNIYWDNEQSSDGSNTAYIRDEDMQRIAKHLTPPWFMAAADGLEWADLGKPYPPDPEYPVPEVYESVVGFPVVAPADLPTYWIGKE